MNERTFCNRLLISLVPMLAAHAYLAATWPSQEVDPASVARWRAEYGPDWWMSRYSARPDPGAGNYEADWTALFESEDAQAYVALFKREAKGECLVVFFSTAAEMADCLASINVGADWSGATADLIAGPMNIFYGLRPRLTTCIIAGGAETRNALVWIDLLQPRLVAGFARPVSCLPSGRGG